MSATVELAASLADAYAAVVAQRDAALRFERQVHAEKNAALARAESAERDWQDAEDRAAGAEAANADLRECLLDLESKRAGAEAACQDLRAELATVTEQRDGWRADSFDNGVKWQAAEAAAADLRARVDALTAEGDKMRAGLAGWRASDKRWQDANEPGGWIDDLRREAAAGRALRAAADIEPVRSLGAGLIGVVLPLPYIRAYDDATAPATTAATAGEGVTHG